MPISKTESLETKEDLERVYNLYFDKIFRVAKMLLRDEANAADAVQETFIRVYKYRASYDHKSSFNAWITTILINECKRQIEKEKRITYIEDYETVKELSSDWTKEWENKELAHSLLKQLEEPIKVPIVLKYIQGLKIDEIAKILKLNSNTVKSRLAFGRKKMREHYEEERGEESL
ncbi:MAG: sigma-70 family RNA polymerase sigma factor [Cellulosilyticum sp.]|nr:sigma-70 family RNA polymerase sigma factor [Cellulosilyticum sp.]